MKQHGKKKSRSHHDCLTRWLFHIGHQKKEGAADKKNHWRGANSPAENRQEKRTEKKKRLTGNPNFNPPARRDGELPRPTSASVTAVDLLGQKS